MGIVVVPAPFRLGPEPGRWKAGQVPLSTLLPLSALQSRPRRTRARRSTASSTRTLRQFAEEGEGFDDATIPRLSPYLTEHADRFGRYTLNLDRESSAPGYTLDLRPGMEPALATASMRGAHGANGPFCLESLPYPNLFT